MEEQKSRHLHVVSVYIKTCPHDATSVLTFLCAHKVSHVNLGVHGRDLLPPESPDLDVEGCRDVLNTSITLRVCAC